LIPKSRKTGGYSSPCWQKRSLCRNGKRGGKEVWDSHALWQLLTDFWEVKRQNPDLKSEEKLCEKLTEKKGYKGKSPKTLRKMLYRARDPADNDILKLLLEEPDPIARADLMRKLST
jgi:hypothetical protein